MRSFGRHGALHTPFADIKFLKFDCQLFQLWSQDSKLFLKYNAVLIENTHKDAIFVDVKTADLSHGHNKFWDTKPVKHIIFAARQEATQR